ncbi:MAG: transglutaminaseTgpA domain-containing protein [Acidobacteriota bacterium]
MITFGREKRQLLGWLALLVPLPLPFNQVLSWPVLFAYSFLVIYFLHRVEQGKQDWLPNWALNALGLVYMPVLFIDVRHALIREQAVRAILHLILFVVVAKLFSIRREKDKWHIFILIFFTFVAAMATSSHLTIAIYLIAALAAGFGVMMRFAHLHVLARLGQSARSGRDGAEARAPSLPSMRWASVTSLVLIVLMAVPIFASLPRLRQPFVMGQGAGNIGLSRTTGFSDSVNLSLTSQIRSNTSIALRLETDQTLVADDLRFKGATYDFYRNNNWHRHPLESRRIFADDDGILRMPGAGEGNLRATIYLEPLRSQSLVVPMRTVGVDAGGRANSLRLDAGGGLVLPQPPGLTIAYDVILGETQNIAGELASDPQLRLDALDFQGLSPRIIELARQVMGQGSDEERADRLLRHLLTEYQYTLDFTGREGIKPLEEFLFEYRSGQCELFAASMVLMLRSQGIPARFVSGFLGAEFNTLEGTYVVRHSNAHAWVEAYTPERGWRVYDPTPPDGRPAARVQDWKLWLQQLYDYLAFRWDRYVLGYGADDQTSFFSDLRSRLQQWWQRWLQGDEEKLGGDTAVGGLGDLGPLDELATPATALWQRPWVRAAGLALILLTAAAFYIYQRRRQLTPEEAYAQLRAGLAEVGLDIDDSTPPLKLRELLAARYPEASTQANAVIDIYVRQAFAGRPAKIDDTGELYRSVSEALRSAAEAEKARAKASKVDVPDRRAA